MKPIYYLLLLTVLCILCACPYSSAWRLDEEPLLPLDETLLGKWAAFVKKPDGREEPVKLIFTRKTASEYAIAITGYLDELRPYGVFTADSIRGEGFLSVVADKTFLNLTVQSRSYICEVNRDNGKLSLLPLCEHFTARLVKNSAALRAAVEFHCKTRLRMLYDDPFCLRNLVRVN